MHDNHYDVIVVGARCAGSPTAMLLARKGYRVLVVDRATFPSDTVSTHLVHPPGVAALERWGLLDRLVATGCPPIDTYAFDFGPFTLAGVAGHRRCPGRVRPAPHGARQAAGRRGGGGGRRGARGVHGRRGRDRGRTRSPASAATARAAAASPSTPRRRRRGRAGTRSWREAVRPEQYNEKPPLLCGYYTYWSGLPMDGRFEAYVRPDRGFAAWPDQRRPDAGRRRLAVRGVRGQQEGRRGQLPADVRARPRRSRSGFAAPGARRASSARRCPTSSASPSARAGRWSATRATTRTSSRRRGSATRSGTRSCAPTRCDESFSGARPFDDAMGEYQSHAATSMCLPMYEFTCQLATLEPPPPEMQQLLGAVARQPGGDGRFRPGQRRGRRHRRSYFSEENVDASSPPLSDRPGRRASEGPANRSRPQVSPLIAFSARLGCTRIGSPGIFGQRREPREVPPRPPSRQPRSPWHDARFGDHPDTPGERQRGLGWWGRSSPRRTTSACAGGGARGT